MGQRSDIDDFRYLNTSTMNSTNSRFTTVTGTFNIRLDFSQAKVIGDLRTILSCHLSSIGSILFRTSESHLTGRGPGNDLTVGIGKGNNDVVERRMNVRLSDGVNFDVSFLSCNLLFCHFSMLYLINNLG